MSQENSILLKIDVTKIEKARLFKGQKGTYLDALLIYKPSQYGQDYMVVQSVSKEEREQGIKGPIIGNATILHRKDGAAPAPKPAPQPAPEADAPQDDGPFEHERPHH